MNTLFATFAFTFAETGASAGCQKNTVLSFERGIETDKLVFVSLKRLFSSVLRLHWCHGEVSEEATHFVSSLLDFYVWSPGRA